MRLRSCSASIFRTATEAVCEEGEDGIGAAQSPERTGLFEVARTAAGQEGLNSFSVFLADTIPWKSVTASVGAVNEVFRIATPLYTAPFAPLLTTNVASCGRSPRAPGPR